MKKNYMSPSVEITVCCISMPIAYSTNQWVIDGKIYEKDEFGEWKWTGEYFGSGSDEDDEDGADVKGYNPWNSWEY